MKNRFLLRASFCRYNQGICLEGAIERLLRNFALSLLVPETLYAQVSEWVDRTNSRGRIVYYKVSAKWQDNVFDLHPDSLVRKLDVKPDSVFSAWIRTEIAKRFDYACCGDMGQFRREKQAITIAGQIKAPGNRHEKDDRHNIADRSRYILGWSNEAKISSLDSDRLRLEKDIADTAKEIGEINNKQKKTGERKILLARLNGFETWDEIDWKPVALQAEKLEREKTELESASDKLKALNSQINELESEIKETQTGLDSEKDKRSRNNEKKNHAEELLSECTETIAAAAVPDYESLAAKLDSFRKEALGERHLTIESADRAQQEIREWLQAKIDSEDKKLKAIEERIIKNMQDYRREYPAETTDVDARIESGPEFGQMLGSLEQDDLPRFADALQDASE